MGVFVLIGVVVLIIGLFVTTLLLWHSTDKILTDVEIMQMQRRIHDRSR